MICELHNEEATLCDSHIIPKFVYKWIKESGPGRLRQMGKLNIPLQDGFTKKMLCKDCEDRFSLKEKWFKENVFIPYLEDKTLIVKNDEQLKYFVVSVLWRINKLFKDDGNKYKFKKDLDEAELEWRNYLLNGNDLSKYKNLHLILVDNDYFIDEKSDMYFSRNVDIEIAESNTICFIYAKFSRFILIGEITGLNEQSFENTNLDLEPEFMSANQIINVHEILDFFRSRIENIKDFKDLSEKQQKKNNEYYKDKLNKIEGSDYMKILDKYNKKTSG